MAKIIFFGGKGGVGKTSCSTAYALQSAQNNKKVLLVSTDPAHSISDVVGTRIGNDQPTLIKNNLYGLEINPQLESDRYIKSIKKNLHTIISPVILEEIHRQLQIASVSPGSHESALFDRMIEIMIQGQNTYDVIVFDTAPTGHTIRLISLPELLGAWIDTMIQKRKKIVSLQGMIGNIRHSPGKTSKSDPVIDILLRRKQMMEQVRKIMIDDRELHFFFVLNAEYLAVEETRRALDLLRKYKIHIEALVVNKLLPQDSRGSFWEQKKQAERRNMAEIENLGVPAIYKIPLMDCDMNQYNISRIVPFFAQGGGAECSSVGGVV